MAFSVHNDILYYKGRLFIPVETDFRELLLSEFHNSPMGGHFGVKATLSHLAASFAWPQMAKDVKLFVKNCTTCQQNKPFNQKTIRLLQSLPIPTQVWEDISMDFIIHLHPAKGKTVVWVVIDCLTKFAYFVALPTHFSAATLAPIFIAEIFSLHGMPKTIVSDRDRVFMSKFWRELFSLCGTKLAFSSAYHPEIDGQTEVTNRILETYLRHFVNDTPHFWFSIYHWRSFGTIRPSNQQSE